MYCVHVCPDMGRCEAFSAVSWGSWPEEVVPCALELMRLVLLVEAPCVEGTILHFVMQVAIH